jgi:ABC-type nitrate/sulfonate/bicarbonate transport system substrate-binding protein
MAKEFKSIRVGQFSESPVLAVARALGLDDKYQVTWETTRVPSSPGQFQMLRDGEIDLAITSPDNVILYATTSKNPLDEQLRLSFLRPVDRGLGLALYTSPKIATVNDFHGATLGVDVMSSGFAILLLSMLRQLGVDLQQVTFEAVGATPKRVEAVVAGGIHGTILNAESAVAAEESGLKRWATSVDVTPHYLGTVLAQLEGPLSDETKAFLELWEEGTHVILSSQADELIELLGRAAPTLASAAYVSILQSEDFGLLETNVISLQQLSALAAIRTEAAVYAPTEGQLSALLGENL